MKSTCLPSTNLKNEKWHEKKSGWAKKVVTLVLSPLLIWRGRLFYWFLNEPTLYLVFCFVVVLAHTCEDSRPELLSTPGAQGGCARYQHSSYDNSLVVKFPNMKHIPIERQ